MNELVEALEDARDVLYQVAHGNTGCGKDAECVGGLIATALANAKAAQPLTELYAKQCSLQAGESDGDVNYADGCHDCAKRIREMAAPAQPVNELVEALQGMLDLLEDSSELSRKLAIKDAHAALANAKAAQPFTKEQVREHTLDEVNESIEKTKGQQ